MSIYLADLHHVGLVVRDMETMRTFYRRLFGMEPAVDVELTFDRAPAPGGPASRRLHIVVFRPGAAAVELTRCLDDDTPAASRERCAAGLQHLAFRVPDVADACERLTAAGIAFEVGPRPLGSEAGPLDGFTVASFRDPEGNLIELVEEPSLLAQQAARARQALAAQ